MRAIVSVAYRRLVTLVEWLTIALTGLLVVIVSVNVFARYVLEVGLIWAEEATVILFVWVVFLGAFVAYHRRAHLALTVLTDGLALRPRRIVACVAALLVAVFLSVVLWAGIGLVQQTFAFGRLTAMLGISASWGYLAVPVTAGLMVLETIRQIFVPAPVGGPDQGDREALP